MFVQAQKIPKTVAGRVHDWLRQVRFLPDAPPEGNHACAICWRIIARRKKAGR